MDVRLTDGIPTTAQDTQATVPGSGASGVLTEPVVAPELLADLDHPNLVLSDGYVGPDRRRTGLRARVARATFGPRRSLLRMELLVVLAVVVLGIGSFLVMGGGASQASRATVPVHAASSDAPALPAASRPLIPVNRAPAAVAPSTTPSTTPTTAAGAASSPPATTPTPAATPAPTATVPVAAPVAAAPTTTVPAAAATTPAQLGAEALTLVRYPWQSIPGYTIQFLPIADAPEPGFYGNTTFTWGRPGGTSVLYVYPGETVQRLAAITAFEIGHEVDAAGVEPAGGEAQIENILGIHPASWAPNCDCAEQGFLSGWYAAAFSNAWSPGVGQWSTLAPEPSGAVLTAVEPWLNPAIS